MLGGRKARTFFWLSVLLSLSLACAVAAQSSTASASKGTKDAKRAKTGKSKKETKSGDRTVWNLDGGAFFATDGGFLNGACFRLAGRLDAPGFFDDLKRIDDAGGTTYKRGAETIADFPEKLDAAFTIRDIPCSPAIGESAARPPLTREMMSTLRLHLYWKRGVALRPVENAEMKNASVKELKPYAQDLAKELPKRFEWSYELVVPSDRVPLTDSLVFVLEAPDGRFAARVAARL